MIGIRSFPYPNWNLLGTAPAFIGTNSDPYEGKRRVDHRSAASAINFLWTTFTRFEPAADLHAAATAIRRLPQPA